MGLANTILIVVGIITALLGLIAFFYPNLTRWISAPGGPRLKATIAMVIGVILIIIGVVIELPR
jgi:uncharacterized membrane protein YidH (DUF202 family)